jgi:hypothetical protein
VIELRHRSDCDVCRGPAYEARACNCDAGHREELEGFIDGVIKRGGDVPAALADALWDAYDMRPRNYLEKALGVPVPDPHKDDQKQLGG